MWDEPGQAWAVWFGYLVFASISLTNSSGECFQFGNSAWCFLLDLAERYGWKPAGTQAPEYWPADDPWPGGYDTSDEQTVIAADAKALGDAIAAALADEGLEEKAAQLEDQVREGIAQSSGRELAASYHGALGDPQDYRPYLEEFVEFCREGEFQIE